ncbi:MAG TPA: sodium:calcium antiporter [Coriobacteriia bacterium]
MYLSRATDVLDQRWHLGEAFGGMVLLAISGSLPEVAITVSAALAGRLDVAAGNLLGGIAIQTGVLIICDYFVTEKKPLSYLVGSLIPVLEASLVVGVTALAMLGALLPPTEVVWGMSPASIAIVVVWLFGMVVINRVRNAPKWKVAMPGSKPGRPHRRIQHPTVVHPYHGFTTVRLTLIFLGGSIATLVAGVVLTQSGTLLADRYGVGGVIFGATALAVASALPEIATGITAAKLGDNQLVMGDIFGGNAFQVTLFIVADLIAGKAALASAGAQNSWLAGLGILTTMVYAASVIVRPEKNYFRIGIDSIVVLVMLIVGMIGLGRIPV